MASEVQIKKLVEDVERECPFAKSLGFLGKGEGIAWKADEGYGCSSYWFKSKGDSLAVSHCAKLPPSAIDIENKERVTNFAKAIVTEMRLEQGWKYLNEKEDKGIPKFLSWITNDCFAEEQREREELKISKKQLKPAIVQIARPWLKARLARGT